MVASFRLPVAVKGLIFLSDWLRKQYGEGLTMRQQGEFLFIEKPNAGAVPRRDSDVGTSPLLGRKSEEACTARRRIETCLS
jgi:hypothetical protein